MTLSWGCTQASLEEDLKGRPTVRLLFSGHSGSGRLGYTTPGGGEVVGFSDDVAELLGQHSVKRGGKLSLVVLNGCNSEALGLRLRAAGVPCVVCWRTPTLDKAARMFASALFKACATAAMAAVPAPPEQTIRYAFDAACDAVKLFKTKTKNPQTGQTGEVTAFVLTAPPMPPPTGHPGFPIAAGRPVLLCDGAGGDGVPIRVGA